MISAVSSNVNPVNRQRGMTLLEVMVAFVIFGLIFATVLQILSGSLRNTQRSAEYTQAALWAQSRLDAIGIDPPLEEGSYDGEFDDDYRWELSIQPYEFNDAEAAVNVEEFPVELFYVELLVTWGEQKGLPRQARFSTLRSAVPQRAP